MKTVRLAISILIILLFGEACSRKSDNDGTTFTIDNYSQTFKFDDIVSDFKVLTLHTTDEFVLGRIKDICFTDKRIYVLDVTTASIFIFDKETGAMIKTISQKGAGPNEYISPWAIDCDSSHVWLLDFSKKIIVYDEDLNYLKTVNIPHMAFDFIYTGDGFLLRLATLHTYKFVHVDLNGSEKAKYIPITAANNDGKSNYGDALELLRAGNKSFFCDGYRNQIYVLKDSIVRVSYELDFGKLNIPDDVNPNNYDITQDFPYIWKPTFFLLSNHLIVDFISPKDNNRYYSFINLSTGANFSGHVNDIENTPPFFPQRQDGENLVGWFTYGEVSHNSIIGNKLSEALNDVSALDYDDFILIFYTLKPSL
jgi:hypothetical protein